MDTLYLKNSRELASSVDKYPDGEYWVSQDISGYRVFIKKPGVKPGSPKDIAVSISYPNGSSKSPTHKLLVSDYKQKCQDNPEIADALFSQIEQVMEGNEPDWQLEGDCPGLPVKILLHALKWVWIQEDRNYPPPRLQGRRMNWSTYLLYWHGDIDLHSKEGEAFLKKYGYTDNEIFNIRHRSGGKNLR